MWCSTSVHAVSTNCQCLRLSGVPRYVSDFRSNPLQNGLQSHSTSVTRSEPTRVVLTKTHIIHFQTYTKSPNVPVLVQAFAVPDAVIPRGMNEVGELHLTHQTVTYIIPDSLRLLRDSVADPVTGSLNIRLLRITSFEHGFGRRKRRMSCFDLTLPKSTSTTDVLPISIRS